MSLFINRVLLIATHRIVERLNKLTHVEDLAKCLAIAYTKNDSNSYNITISIKIMSRLFEQDKILKSSTQVLMIC